MKIPTISDDEEVQDECVQKWRNYERRLRANKFVMGQDQWEQRGKPNYRFCDACLVNDPKMSVFEFHCCPLASYMIVWDDSEIKDGGTGEFKAGLLIYEFFPHDGDCKKNGRRRKSYDPLLPRGWPRPIFDPKHELEEQPQQPSYDVTHQPPRIHQRVFDQTMTCQQCFDAFFHNIQNLPAETDVSELPGVDHNLSGHHTSDNRRILSLPPVEDTIAGKLEFFGFWYRFFVWFTRNYNCSREFTNKLGPINRLCPDDYAKRDGKSVHLSWHLPCIIYGCEERVPKANEELCNHQTAHYIIGKSVAGVSIKDSSEKFRNIMKPGVIKFALDKTGRRIYMEHPAGSPQKKVRMNPNWINYIPGDLAQGEMTEMSSDQVPNRNLRPCFQVHMHSNKHEVRLLDSIELAVDYRYYITDEALRHLPATKVYGSLFKCLFNFSKKAVNNMTWGATAARMAHNFIAFGQNTLAKHGAAPESPRTRAPTGPRRSTRKPKPPPVPFVSPFGNKAIESRGRNGGAVTQKKPPSGTKKRRLNGSEEDQEHDSEE